MTFTNQNILRPKGTPAKAHKASETRIIVGGGEP